MTRLLAMFAVLALSLVLCGCAPKSLPRDWPIPQLTLPPGTRLQGDVSHVVKSDRETWFADVSPSNWDGLVASTESCLKPLGYRRLPDLVMERPNRRYVSGDLITIVSIIDAHTEQSRPAEAFFVPSPGYYGSYYLTIDKLQYPLEEKWRTQSTPL